MIVYNYSMIQQNEMLRKEHNSKNESVQSDDQERTHSAEGGT